MIGELTVFVVFWIVAFAAAAVAFGKNRRLGKLLFFILLPGLGITTFAMWQMRIATPTPPNQTVSGSSSIWIRPGGTSQKDFSITSIKDFLINVRGYNDLSQGQKH